MEDVEFRQKLQRYKDTVYRIAYTYLRNQADAEDVSQDTFLKLYLREVPFPDDGAEKAWLICVTINACHNLRRSVWHKNRAEMPADIAERLTTPAETALYAAVFSLPEKYRVVVLLYYYEEYSVKEIAQITGRNLSTIQTQLERARKKLKLKLEQKGGFYYGQEAISTAHGTDSDAGVLRTKDSGTNPTAGCL